jgi:F-type H+-transporting ATPase subunit epsilon
MGILPHHEPLLTVVTEGQMRLTDLEGNKRFFKVQDGFASFDGMKLTVAVEDCEETDAPEVEAE